MMRYAEAPQCLDEDSSKRIKLFLGGSIELGKADNWQKQVTEFLIKHKYANHLDVYNPRREGPWDQTWMENFSQGPFREQVEWELIHQKQSDLLIYYFANDTISPITLFELGLFHTKNPIVAADQGYLRLGNLMITSEHFNFDVLLGWGQFIEALDKRINQMIEAD